MKQIPNVALDYDFGQAMLTLRSATGLTQAALAQQLGISRHAVGDWELGKKYPSDAHLKHFITLIFGQGAFPTGQEAERIRALWRSAHQKLLLDEAWLAALLSPAPTALAEQVAVTTAATPVLAGARPRVDWGEALAVPSFYGREWETAMLADWLVAQRCRVVSVLGMGGIGKSALAVTLMRQVAAQFDVVIWRSLRDTPACEALLDSCLQALAPQTLGQAPATLDERINLLLEYLRAHRVLLVLDNLETLLQEGNGNGQMRPGHEGYGKLLLRLAETEHQSCLLFTSREKPGELLAQEGARSPVRALRLARLDAAACAHLLAERNVSGSADEQARLIEAYAGNPLALKIVAQTVVDLFDGAIGPFLEQGAIIFGGVRQLLAAQFNRLSAAEQGVLFWLAIMREPLTFAELGAMLRPAGTRPLPPGSLLETVDGLMRRSMIERGGTVNLTIRPKILPT